MCDFFIFCTGKLTVFVNWAFCSYSAEYKPKKIKTEDIKKAKKRKQEEEEVM